MKKSTTLYVGNLSFYTTEDQCYEVFGKAGPVKRVIMGLDRVRKTPCGFCFVEYMTRQGAENCMNFINKTFLDDRQIRTDWDTGFHEERRYGRGKSGGQVRDEYRDYYDPNRPKPEGYDTEQRQDFSFDDNTPRTDRYGGGGHKRSRSDLGPAGYGRDDRRGYGGGGERRDGDEKRHRAEENNRFRRERDEDDDDK